MQYCRCAAARASFWPDAPLDRIEAAVPSALKPQPGFLFNRRYIPVELSSARACVTPTRPSLPSTWPHSPAATALISVCDPSSNPGKHVRGVAHDSSSRRQSGRLKLLIDSRSEPWSAAERLSHRLLRAAQIKGLGDQPAGVCGWSMVLHRYRLQTAEVGDRDRRPAARDARGSLRVGPLAAERTGGRGLASSPASQW